MQKTVLIIGAGPAGLTAAHQLAMAGACVHVYESSNQLGGLSKTVEHNGFRFDIGGHRFYTKSREVSEYWNAIMGDDFLPRKRLSRIYYNKKFFKYPLELKDLLIKINPFTALHYLGSYASSAIFPPRPIKSLEDWVIANFGKELYLTFFKSYTEKVWGRKCTDLSADWAAQRINNLNIRSLILSFVQSLLGLKNKNIKTLITHFSYPKRGPGMLWEKVAKEIQKEGGQIHFSKKVTKLIQNKDLTWELEFSDSHKSPSADFVISTAPIKNLLEGLVPRPKNFKALCPDEIKYRDFLTVVLMFKMKESFPDNWIYIHEKDVHVARIQNYKNWSEYMVPSDEYTSYGLEYFCQQGDEFWEKTDHELFELAFNEIRTIGLPINDIELDYKVIRVPKAYPVYDHHHKERSELIQQTLKEYPRLHLIGRNGMHRYNNQDHSIKTAMLCAQNILADKNIYNPWRVNQDAIYLEESVE